MLKKMLRSANRGYTVKRVSERMMLLGFHSVMEAIREGKVLDKVYLRRDMHSSIGSKISAALSGSGTLIQRVPVERLDKMTDKNHQGVIAFISPIDFHPIEEIVQGCFEKGRMPFIAILDSLTDVRNVGAIARTCLCAGVDAMVVPMSKSASITSDVIKVSSGALLSLPICRVIDLSETIRYLEASGVKVLAATEHGEKSYLDCDMCVPLALVFGNEERGISEGCISLVTERANIPVMGQVESLNVSVAAGIFLYEVVRQRNSR